MKTQSRCLRHASLALIALSLSVCATWGDTNLVTALADGGPGSLRQAIAASGAGDVIVFATNGTITLTGGELVIANSLTITGPGATNLVVSGSNASRVFNITTSAAVTISGITIRGGKAPDGNAGTDGTPSNTGGGPGGAGANGGGVCNSGNLILSCCVVTGSQAGAGGAGGSGSGMSGRGGYPGIGGHGGGVYSTGPLTLRACLFSANAAGMGGKGGVGGSGGTDGASGGDGGGIFGSAQVTLTACTFTANAAGNGGVFGGSAGGGYNGGPGGQGGGIYSTGPLSLNTCTFAGNSAGPGAAGGGGFTMGMGGAGGSGGGIWSAGTLAVTACSFSVNASGSGGAGSGGSYGSNGGNGGNGGGIYSSSGAASATLDSSLFAGNSAGSGGAAGLGTFPGAPGTPGSGADLSGAYTSRAFNLLGQIEGSTGLTNGFNGDIVGTAVAPVDPLLDPLADNGGPTPTMALQPQSPAVSAGDDSLTGTDQRGFPRLSGTHVDIGAFELHMSGLSAPAVNPTTGLSMVELSVTVNPNGLNTSVYIQYGITTNYGIVTAPVFLGCGSNTVTTNLVLTGLGNGTSYHYRVVAYNGADTSYGADQLLSSAAATPLGDANGDGVVDAAEFALVRQNYWQANPPQFTRLSGLGGGAMQFGVTNGGSPAFSVLASTNLVNWQVLSNAAVPQYLFNDPDAAKYPRRFYRLRWP